jgi:hypothetical protein
VLAQLRTNALQDVSPVAVSPDATLVDAVVHALDVRRPLRNHRTLPPTAFRPAADFCTRARWPTSAVLGSGTRRRIAGVRLVAEDQDWSHGEGPEVCATGEALLLLVSGRPLDPEELRGEGAAQVRGRLGQERVRR